MFWGFSRTCSVDPHQNQPERPKLQWNQNNHEKYGYKRQYDQEENNREQKP